MNALRSLRPVHAFAGLLILSSLCLPLGTGVAVANPVYPDDQSIANGAQLYDLFCSGCHGVDTSSTYSPLSQSGGGDKYFEQAALEQRKEIRAAAEAAEKRKVPWPTWADRPDPDAPLPPDPNQDTAAELAAMINKAHGIESDAGNEAFTTEPGFGADSAAPGFTPAPGATNLADPTTYFYGTSEQEMFNSIADGTGTSMVGWRSELGSDTAIWDVVNYLRSLWGEEWRN